MKNGTKIGFLLAVALTAFSTKAFAESSTELGIDSPIKKAYAGSEYVLFLHEDTSVSGFGSNVNNVLGLSGGETNNTGELVKVSGPTGFKDIKAKRAKAYGYRPLTDNPNLYEWVKIDNNNNKMVNLPVKDADDSSREAPGINHHDGRGYIDSNGQVWMTGSDYYTALGIGTGNPYNRYLKNWVRALDSNANSLIVQLQNEDNTTNNLISETELFTATTDLTIEVAYRNMISSIKDTSLNVELVNENGIVVYSRLNPYKFVDGETYLTKVSIPVEDLPLGKYKIRVTSSNTKFDINVKERKYFNNAKKILFSSEKIGRFVVIDSDDDIYFHDYGSGILKKVQFPSNTHIQPNTVVAGDGFHFAGIDDSGKLWTWDSTTPSLINFNDVEGQPFYDNYKIKEVSVGYGFTMAVSQRKIDNVTEVYVWGNNSMGKLGIDSASSNVSKPTLVTRKGVPLQNIQSIAAGGDFSVIVQNTDDGQLIWTAGQNNKGQLGGGAQLEIAEPQPVPGLIGIKRLFTQNTPQVIAQSDSKMYVFGGNISYPKEFTMPYGLGMPSQWEQTGVSYWREDWLTSPTNPTILVTEEGKIPYAFGGDWAAGRGSEGEWKPIRVSSEFVGNTALNRQPNEYNFKNIKDAARTSYAGVILDENSRIWGWGRYPNSGTGSNQVTNYNDNGAAFSTRYAHPIVLSNQEYAPTIFKSVEGEDYYGYALTYDGKLWLLSSYAYPAPSAWSINNVTISSIYGSPSSRLAAIDSNGELWFTSKNGVEPKKIPKDKYGNKKVISVSNSINHTLFVTEDGSVWAFGNGAQGKLGNGTNNDVNETSPIKVKNVKEAVSVQAGTDFSLALDKQGRVWAWGYSAYGSLGNNFSLTRGNLSTAYGNELPEMTILNNIEDVYLSKNGNKEFKLFGTTREKEKEKVTVKASVLGAEKQTEISNESWNLDTYDQVKPLDWELKWNVNDFDINTNFQSLTKITAEDERGGLIEQFYSGKIVVDNEKPQAPSWGDTCVIDKSLGETCYSPNYFKVNGTNGVDKPVRIYMKPFQKTGEYKAPVGIQMQYRIKQSYGYPATWSEWIDIKNSNSKGYYYDFYQGFLGETQIKIRAKDQAGNVSDENSEYSYSIITNAGAEITDISAEPKSIDNKLSAELKFTASTVSTSSLKTFGVYRKEQGASTWDNITPTRNNWQGTGEQTYTDNASSLLGNKTYEYMVDAENSVTVGKGKAVSVTTYPYEPINLIRKVNDSGIRFTIKQDERNTGKILYKLVIIDNKTGEIYTKSKTSNNMKEEVIYDVKEDDAPFSVLNNSLTIKLLIQGDNQKFLTVIYDDNFENSPSVMEDTNPPEAFIGIEGNVERIIDDKINLINLIFSATDDVSPNNKLKVQFSPDGTDWYGQKADGTWILNLWSDYKTTYTEFKMGSTVGSRIVYVRVKDEAGNIGTSNVPVLISQLVERDDNVYVIDTERNIKSKDTLNNQIHLNNAYIYLTVPKTGNMREVQYSFDGVKWSPWEKLSDGNNTKFVNLPPYEGEHTIMIRYRNELGDITRVKEDYDIVKYVLDKEKPDLQVETNNGTYIVKTDSVTLLLTPIDNLSEQVNLKFTNSQYQYYVDGTQVQSYKFNNNLKQAVFIRGLVDGFNIINIEVTDMAGNKTLKNIRVFKK